MTSANDETLQAPFRSGISIETYQLTPVARALRMPRVNLLTADDVGLGKTIEAGLVAQEMLLRHRARRIMVVCPAPLTGKWHDGYAESWQALLDPQRFARGLEPDKAILEQVMIRRLKEEITEADGTPRFPGRNVEAVPVAYPASEREIHDLLARYLLARSKLAGPGTIPCCCPSSARRATWWLCCSRSTCSRRRSRSPRRCACARTRRAAAARRARRHRRCRSAVVAPGLGTDPGRSRGPAGRDGPPADVRPGPGRRPRRRRPRAPGASAGRTGHPAVAVGGVGRRDRREARSGERRRRRLPDPSRYRGSGRRGVRPLGRRRRGRRPTPRPDSGLSISRSTEAVVAKLVDSATFSLLLVSYNVSPYPRLNAALHAAAGRSVEIILLLERPQDNRHFSASRNEPFPGLPALRWAWPSGRRTNGAALHAKLIVVDRRVAFVGSANLSGRAATDNLKCGLLVRGGTVANDIWRHVTTLADHGRLVRVQ